MSDFFIFRYEKYTLGVFLHAQKIFCHIFVVARHDCQTSRRHDFYTHYCLLLVIKAAYASIYYVLQARETFY
jgi:hypothetical protein